MNVHNTETRLAERRIELLFERMNEQRRRDLFCRRIAALFFALAFTGSVWAAINLFL